jgi:hypothetical protein
MTLGLAVLASAPSVARAQGSWGVPFNHETINGPLGTANPNPNATDHLIPFGGHQNPNINYYYHAPTGVTFDWLQRLNAVHMCLIPKGPHRGKVVVWGAAIGLNGAPVLARAPGFGPAIGANDYWACSAWSIVDPSPAPGSPRFRNFLLPIETFTAPSVTTTSFHAASLFCAGHAWSPHGDLVVAGGTRYGVPTLQGPVLTFAFNPSASVRGWPPLGGGAPLYPGEVGLWEPGPDLQFGRFYPTVTVTHQLSRLGTASQPPREVAVVSGGSIDDASPDPVVNHTWNSYEALVIGTQPASLTNSRLTTDSVGGVSVWPGPGTPGNPPPVEEDWLEDYPRMHLLSTGELFFSGYAPRWAKVDHDLAPGVWIRQVNPPWSSTPWQFPRHDDSSILYPNVGGLKDMVVRLGGADEVNYQTAPNGTTATIEAWVKLGTGGFWVPAGNLPNAQPGTYPDGRYLMNVVILPDASLLALGGVARLPGGPKVNTYEPLLYKNNVWSVLPANPVVSARDYHSSAVLLPDGRVILGGGDSRSFDYEIYSPQYMTLPKPQNLAFSPVLALDPNTGATPITYDADYVVKFNPLPVGEYIDKAVLMAPGAATHHSDMHQRYVGMTIAVDTTQDASITTAVQFHTPLNDKHAPRGVFMLFLVTSSGAVADAVWVVLR